LLLPGVCSVLPVSASNGSAAEASPSAPLGAAALLADRLGLAPGAGAFAALRSSASRFFSSSSFSIIVNT
jgi:hypothetical protein